MGLDNERLKAIEKMVDWMAFKLDYLSHVFEHSTAAFSAQVDRGEDEFEAIVDDEHNRLMQLDDASRRRCPRISSGASWSCNSPSSRTSRTKSPTPRTAWT